MNSKQKHTKGPWKIIDDSLHSQVVADSENNPICTTLGMTVREQGNLGLIAAAPELLEQVKYALKFCRAEGIDQTWECALEKVIAKAEGN